MTLHVSVSGVNKRVLGIWVGVGGAWKKVLTGHTSVAGAFKKFFSSGSVVSPLEGGAISSITYSGGGNSSSMSFLPDGSLSAATGGMDESDTITGDRWFTDTPDQAYAVYATLVSTSGGGTTSGTFNTWLPISGNPTWGVGRGGTTTGFRSINVKFKVRRISDSVEVIPDTNSFFISAGTDTSDGGGGGETP